MMIIRGRGNRVIKKIMKVFENLCIKILKKIFCEKLKLSRTNSEDRVADAAD